MPKKTKRTDKKTEVMGYTIVNKKNNKIMDDGFDYPERMVVIYPMFIEEKDARLYAQKTYNVERLLTEQYGLKFKWYQDFKIIKCRITQVVGNKKK